jgi:putative DNA primase/helicase
LKAIEHWIVELGELDATFKKSDIAKLKAFISEKIDIVRRPYAKRESKYPRQTVFCASVNDKDFLKDSSGNVRFWVIPVLKLNAYHNLDMQQVWAEVAHSYKQGEIWWLTREEEILLESSNRYFVEENRFAAALYDKFNWENPKKARLTTHEALAKIGIDRPLRADISDMNKLLTEWFGEQHKSGKLRFYNSHRFLSSTHYPY